MTDVGLAVAAAPVLVLLLVLRVPVAVAMLAVGSVGFVAVAGPAAYLNYLTFAPFDRVSSYTLSIVPLFLLMGEFAVRAGIGVSLFDAARALLGGRRGGLPMAAILGSAAFGAVAGSSVATAATMARVALPEMRRHGVPDDLATGSVAAGGTLGILVPPSVALVLYAVLAEQNIAHLFAAALVPAAVATVLYVAAVAVLVRVRPYDVRPPDRSNGRQRMRAILATWPALTLFVLVIGGIYAGVFTPTEAASIGVVAAALLAVARGRLGRRELVDSVLGAARTTGMIFLILLGADVLNVFLTLTRAPQALAAAAAGWDVPPLVVLVAILAVFVALGCIMDSLGMLLLALPVVLPVVGALEFGLPPEATLLWFGILVVTVVEVGLVTPPVGLNVYVIHAASPDVPVEETFRGVLPFLAADVLRIALLVAFPALTLALVDRLF